ncbi:phospholipase/carboxylesterase superfamily [Synechococcus sp. PCC 7335]|uniref:alpha/beta hydrolase n=1 Tax=Synechococcus sp. (strain ATCC 29403 / PCC 7335) TaxID=91464 RepID=UPI00017ED9CD|nr:phospholipase/carboxylesterase superfamily [Synechococcus sp. PCC 7335]EDX87121.1 phospholipase/carboxylesterase superfamily [Synechococcus sp. PCC 7335]
MVEQLSLNAIAITPEGAGEQLIVLLHGWGANAQDVAGVINAINMVSSPTRALLPDAPFTHPMVPGGLAWYSFPANYDFRRAHNFEAQADLRESRQRLLYWMRSLPEKTGIPLEKTIMGGFSQGGAMTLDIAPQLPLAAMLILSSYSHAPIPPCITPRPILLVHGRQDPVVPLARALEAKSQLESQGLAVTYHEFDMGHEVSMDALKVASQFCLSL